MRAPCAEGTNETQGSRALFAALLQHLGDEPRPPRLMAGADSRAVVAVKILVKKHQIAKVGVALEALVAPRDRAPPLVVAQKKYG